MHRPRNSKADFTFLTLLRRERRRTDPERTFFLSVSVRSRTRHGLRNSHLSRACEALHTHYSTALCFQPLLFPHVWWRELKDTMTARFFRKSRRADRQHELPSVWVSIVCETRIAKLPSVVVVVVVVVVAFIYSRLLNRHIKESTSRVPTGEGEGEG